MASSKEPHYASMPEDELLWEQTLQQIMSRTLEGTTDDTPSKRSEFDGRLKQIEQALGKFRSRPEDQKKPNDLKAPYRPKAANASSMSGEGMDLWGYNNQFGGSGSKKRTFDTHIGAYSLPQPSKSRRPAIPSGEGQSWNRFDSSSPPIIDLSEDSNDMVRKQGAEEERLRILKQQEEEDAAYARRLQNEFDDDVSPTPGPSRPNTLDQMSNLRVPPYRPSSESSRHVKPKPSSRFQHDVNSLSSLQPGTPHLPRVAGSSFPAQRSEEDLDYSNVTPKVQERMPGSFGDDIDDLFGDIFSNDINFPNIDLQAMSGTNSPYSAGTDNYGSLLSLTANENAGQAALRRQQQQFVGSAALTNGSSISSTPTPDFPSSFTPASQVWDGQSLQRPGSLRNGSCNPLDYGGSDYGNSYRQSGSGAGLGDIINRTAAYDYVNGTDRFGNQLDRRVQDLMIDSGYNSSQEEGIKRLLANIGPEAESLDADEQADPKGLVFPLYKHQRQALHWMTRMEEDQHKKGGILADDMGLGKTVSSIALMISHRPQPPPGKTYVRTKTTLIVAPVALLDQWRREIETKLKPGFQLTVFKYHNTRSTYEDLRSFDVVITTYGTLASEMNKLENYMKGEDSGPKDDTTVSGKFPLLGPKSLWYRVIIDEAQCIKNPKTKNAKAAHRLKSEFRWCLSGTPMMNNVFELSSLVTFLRIEPYCAADQFKQTFSCLSVHRSGGYQKSESMKKLQILLRAIMLRRTKNSTIDGQPIIDLPPKVEEQVHVVFNEDEAAFYNDLERDSQVRLSRYFRDGAVGKKYTVILTLLLRLRQACCHPYLHLTDLDYVGSDSVGEDEMVRLAKTMDPDVVRRLKGLPSFECPICYDVTANPIFILPCGHDTCSECFVQLTDGPDQRAVQAGQENGRTHCPQCRGPVDARKIVAYDVFKKVHLPEQIKAEDPNADEYETDSDSDSDLGKSFGDEDHVSDDADDIDEDGNLKDFIDDSGLDHGEVNGDIRKKSQKKMSSAVFKKEPGDELESSDLEDIDQMLARHDQVKSKDVESMGEDKIGKTKKLRPKGKKKEEAIKPHMLGDLRREARKNRAAHKKYMHYLKKIWEPSAKVTKCKDLIKEIQSTNEKTIVFSQWTLLLDLLEIPLKTELGVKYRRYDGSMSAAMRVTAANDFTDLPDVKVILVSLKAGNAGLNLNAASQVIIMDPFWNPYIEMQAVDRAHRIGQRRTVKVHRILIQDTVEDRIVQLQERKREIIDSALDEEAGRSVSSLNQQDFAFLFGLGRQYTT